MCFPLFTKSTWLNPVTVAVYDGHCGSDGQNVYQNSLDTLIGTPIGLFIHAVIQSANHTAAVQHRYRYRYRYSLFSL